MTWKSVVRKSVYGTAVTCLVAGVLSVGPAGSAESQLVVDVSTDTGALRYGATGFLYGLGDEGIPNETMLAALKPQVTAQKAPDGLQHPNGDALKVAPMFKRAGGREVQIYMQDIYSEWPYQDLGIDDYLEKVEEIAQKVVADPHRESYVYVPFNEPDGIWYSGDLDGLLTDWKTVYERIHQIDPGARIAGPGFSHYRPSDMRQFMTFARDNDVLPDVAAWHELGDDFYTDWHNHYDDYRDIESDLGIDPLPISINEYGRSSGDLGVPGNLVQYVSKFENYKVDGCLAYWTTAGGLNELVTRNNQATGAWWLYKWYGELTGHTVEVTPPAVTSSLQGVAAYDPEKTQARVIFGGNNPADGSYDTDVIVDGLDATEFGNTVHVSVWGVDATGENPSSRPYLVTEGDYATSGGAITVPLTGLNGQSAYHAIVTPDTDTSPVGDPSRYEAEYASIDGTAKVTYGTNTGYSGTYFVEGYGASTTASTTFVVSVPADGYYDLGLRYSAGPYSGAPTDRSISLRVNGDAVADVNLPGTPDWNTWSTATTKVFLPAGISQVEFAAYTADDRDAVNIDYLDVSATSGDIATHQAESGANTMDGTARVVANDGADGGYHVGWIGNGADNTLTFNDITVPEAGTYRMVVAYANAEVEGDHQYNTNIVDRLAEISVNGAQPQVVYFRNTFAWDVFRTRVVDVELDAGTNSITFGNPSSGYAPDIDLIRLAAPVG